MDNIPIGLIVAWAALMSISVSTFNNKTDHALAQHIVLIASAVCGGARLGHTMIVYVAKLSVLRTAAVWSTGQLPVAVLAMGINAIISSFSV